MELILEPATLLGPGWLRRDAPFGRNQRLEDQPTQGCARPLEVLALRTLGLSGDEQTALGVEAASGKFAQTALLGLGQRVGAGQVEAKHYLRRHFVHVLAAGAG